MTEEEYIIATNRVKVSMALTILRDTLAADDYETYGLYEGDRDHLIGMLRRIEKQLFDLTEIKPEPREWVITGPSEHADGPEIPIGHAIKVREVME